VLPVAAACTGGDDVPPTVATPTSRDTALEVTTDTGEAPFSAQRPGNPAVYERIAGLTDCAALQDELDTAMTNAELRERGDPIRTVSIAYAEFTAERMDDLAC
jgi:hypothetical protein